MAPLATAVGTAASETPILSDASAGWSTKLDVSIEGSTSVAGGWRSGQTVHGLALASAAWSQPTKGRTGFSLAGYASALSLCGTGPSKKFVGDALGLSNIEGHQSTRLYSWWMEAGDEVWQFRAGALLADEEFAGTDIGGRLLNSTFGWPTFISANTVNTGPAFYAAAPGLRVRRMLREGAYIQAGIYDGDTFDSPAGDPHINGDGLHLHVGGHQGWFGITELGFSAGPVQSQFKFGAWVHSAVFPDVYADRAGRSYVASGNEPREHRGNFGAYAVIEQRLAGKPGEPGELAAYLRAGVSPPDRNAVNWALDSGLATIGPIRARPTDQLTLGVARASFSDAMSRGRHELAPANPRMDFETVIEGAYAAELSKCCKVRASLQYILHPGGSPARRDATVFLLRLETQL